MSCAVFCSFPCSPMFLCFNQLYASCPRGWRVSVYAFQGGFGGSISGGENSRGRLPCGSSWGAHRFQGEWIGQTNKHKARDGLTEVGWLAKCSPSWSMTTFDVPLCDSRFHGWAMIIHKELVSSGMLLTLSPPVKIYVAQEDYMWNYTPCHTFHILVRVWRCSSIFPGVTPLSHQVAVCSLSFLLCGNLSFCFCSPLWFSVIKSSSVSGFKSFFFSMVFAWSLYLS